MIVLEPNTQQYVAIGLHETYTNLATSINGVIYDIANGSIVSTLNNWTEISPGIYRHLVNLPVGEYILKITMSLNPSSPLFERISVKQQTVNTTGGNTAPTNQNQVYGVISG